MMVELLSTHTSMNVVQAADGLPIERDHVYVIPPGTSLSVTADTLFRNLHNHEGAKAIEFVFVSACHSHAVGKKFEAFGVRHGHGRRVPHTRYPEGPCASKK